MSEYNVCGVLVTARPENSLRVEQALNALDGVAVHARADDGRLVVTVEGSPGRQCADTITGLNDTDGVVATALVYHETAHEAPQQEPAS